MRKCGVRKIKEKNGDKKNTEEWKINCFIKFCEKKLGRTFKENWKEKRNTKNQRVVQISNWIICFYNDYVWLVKYTNGSGCKTNKPFVAEK